PDLRRIDARLLCNLQGHHHDGDAKRLAHDSGPVVHVLLRAGGRRHLSIPQACPNNCGKRAPKMKLSSPILAAAVYFAAMPASAGQPAITVAPDQPVANQGAPFLLSKTCGTEP